MPIKLSLSIIIPCCNSATFIRRCLNSIFLQSHHVDHEIICIDDHSTDKTRNVIYDLIENVEYFKNYLKLYSNVSSQRGPGIARNIGIAKSTKTMLLFLDSDDLLSKNAFYHIDQYFKFQHCNADIIPFNYSITNNITLSAEVPTEKFRKDSRFFGDKEALISSYLEMKMDGSVIYTLFSRNFVLRNKIQFRDGLHEDIDFLFDAIFFSKNIALLDEIIYIKINRNDSIVNTFSNDHIKGYIAAWSHILMRIKTNQSSYTKLTLDLLLESYKVGIRGAIGVLMSNKRNQADFRFKHKLIEVIQEDMELVTLLETQNISSFNSKYDMLYLDIHKLIFNESM